ncbi:GntR family transcriptional regulator [Consotaella salsifontis]|uniref:Transcriptional regulator, GntR family n=1 Tax=Consotaella salsifontis TaxID=1365950 RepID=A0A1T4RM80_9HYPH|nr:GntR family transcriptional regulator [Consotaella salsifontis]SKA16886.1 transcriptional regulator, GntR family [Consotaella salsifontis]
MARPQLDKMNPVKIQMRTKSETIYSDLKGRILSGELKAETRLKIRELATLYGSSDIPVREALKELAAENLIEMSPHKGSVVKNLSFKEMRDMLEVREVLEPLAAKLAAEHATPELVAALKAINAKCVWLAQEGDYLEYSDANREFHRLITESCGNDYINKIMSELLRVQLYTKTVFDLFPDIIESSLKEHREIIELIEHGSGDEVYNLILKHKRRAYNKLREHFGNMQAQSSLEGDVRHE